MDAMKEDHYRRALQHQVPDLEVMELLGAGGFGAVFKCRWRDDLDLAAVKVLHLDDGDSRVRFEREVQALAERVDSPHVVAVQAWDLGAQVPWFAMEFCPNGSLQPWVQRHQDWRNVAAALLHAALGLQAIHEVGGYHRDVKPQNILATTTPEGAPIFKLGDFGLARVPSPDSSGTLTRTPAGTNGYAAPEVYQGNVCSASDIFSLGITGVELLTASRLVDGLDVANAPTEFKMLIRRMVRTSVKGRPSCQEVIEELRKIIAKAKVKPRRPTPKGRHRRKKKTNGGDLLAGLLLGAVVIGGVAIAAKALDDG